MHLVFLLSQVLTSLIMAIPLGGGGGRSSSSGGGSRSGGSGGSSSGGGASSGRGGNVYFFGGGSGDGGTGISPDIGLILGLCFGIPIGILLLVAFLDGILRQYKLRRKRMVNPATGRANACLW
jgi:hypothetical protein